METSSKGPMDRTPPRGVAFERLGRLLCSTNDGLRTTTIVPYTRVQKYVGGRADRKVDRKKESPGSYS